MELGAKIAEGKTKIIYAHPTDPALLVLQHKDGITAGDGVRRNTIPGKGALAAQTTTNVFTLLNRAGIATHFVRAPEPALTIVRRCAMLPLEVVMRRIATGSYLKRYPQVSEGIRFDPLLVEFFLKDDQCHDPQITEAEIVAQGIATVAEVQQMSATGRQVFTRLEQAWAAQEVTLVDLKIEFGYGVVTANQQPPTASTPLLLVADVIDNDSWRIWPGGEKGRMLDKQVYRNAPQVDDAVLAEIYGRYARVAELTAAFAQDTA